MRNFLLLLSIYISAPICSSQTVKDIVGSSYTSILWMGIDYSQVKLYGSCAPAALPGFEKVEKEAEEIRDVYFPAWNQLILNESDKYNLARALRRSKIPSDLTMMEVRNSDTDLNNMFALKKVELSPEAILNIIQSYEMSVIDKKKGIALVFIMESMNKNTEKAIMYVTFFNIRTKEVLITERMIGRASGAGFRNYWVRPFYEVIKRIYESKYKSWKYQYLD